MQRPRALGGAVLVLLAATAVRAQAPEAPRDDAVLADLEVASHAEVEVSELVAMWGRRFQALVAVDPQLRSVKVRFVTPVTSLTWGATKAILNLHDVVVLEGQPTPGQGWLIRAHHRQNAPGREPSHTPIVAGADAPLRDELVTAVFPIKHGAAQSIYVTVAQIWRRDPNARLGSMFHVPGPELIIIIDQSVKVRYYGQLIEALDVAGPRRDQQVRPLRHAEAGALATVVTQALTALGPGAGQPQVQAPGVVSAPPQVIAEPRTNQLIISANPVDLPRVLKLIDDLDVRLQVAPDKMHVYRCKAVEAQYLAEMLRELLTGKRPAAGGDEAGRGATTLGPPAGAGPPGVASGGEVPTHIVADTRLNALLIQAEDAAYRQVLRLLAELDQTRRRVMIECEVWEVSTPTDQLRLGVELAALTSPHEDRTRPAAGTSFGLSQLGLGQDAQGQPALTRTPSIGAGLTALVTRDTFNKIPLILNMVANFETARQISKPFAVTNDNESATFSVEESRPFLENSATQLQVTQSVKFADASSTLTIKPQVNSDDNLTLEVDIKISTFSGSGSANLPPGRASRSYKGKITVPNARYVIFGGLEQETEREAEDKVPVLGDIPILGHLFKTWTRSRSKTRVYIFIRPTIHADEGFATDTRVSEDLRRRAHAEAEREEWLPPIAPDRLLREAGYGLQDEAFERFGTGSADPFAGAVAWRE